MKNILLTPGPINTTESVKRAMLEDLCPREEEFSKLVTSIRNDLVKIAGGNSKYTCVLFNSSGTGVMEASMGIVNKALILSNGLYGERFNNIADQLGVRSVMLGQRWGEILNTERLKRFLADDIDAVFMTHHETSTGILNNIQKVSEITRKHNIPLVVDCISSFGSIPFNIIDEGADVIISTSSKGLQGVPGISFMIFKKEMLERMVQRSYYFNVPLEYNFQEQKSQFRFTPPVQVILALRKALDELFEEGLQSRYDRYCNNYRRMVAGMHFKGFESYLPREIPRSCLLETFKEPKNFYFKEFHDKLQKKGFIVYPGVLQEKTFRIGCMGDVKEKDIEKFLSVVDEI